MEAFKPFLAIGLKNYAEYQVSEQVPVLGPGPGTRSWDLVPVPGPALVPVLSQPCGPVAGVSGGRGAGVRPVQGSHVQHPALL